MNWVRFRNAAWCAVLVLLLQGCEAQSPAKEAPDDHESHDGHDGDDDRDDHADSEVRLSQAALEGGGIRLAPPRAATLEQSLEVAAEVELNPDRVAHISPLVAAKVLRVDVRKGDVVKPGDTLVQLRSVELGQARAELRRARALMDVAQRNRERQRQLRKEGITSERSLLEAELAFDQANAELEAARSGLLVFGLSGGNGPDMTLNSPIDGTIISRHATRGENASPDDTLFVVADLSTLWVIGQVPERSVSQVKVGMPATLRLTAFPGKSWSGKVDYVGSTLDATTRSLPIRVEVENSEGLLRPGLYGTIGLSADTSLSSTLLVPIGAVQSVEGRDVVFVPGDHPGEFKSQPVKLGKSGRDFVEVIEGLDASSKVVVEGAFLLKSEMVRGELGHGHAH